MKSVNAAPYISSLKRIGHTTTACIHLRIIWGWFPDRAAANLIVDMVTFFALAKKAIVECFGEQIRRSHVVHSATDAALVVACV